MSQVKMMYACECVIFVQVCYWCMHIMDVCVYKCVSISICILYCSTSINPINFTEVTQRFHCIIYGPDKFKKWTKHIQQFLRTQCTFTYAYIVCTQYGHKTKGLTRESENHTLHTETAECTWLTPNIPSHMDVNQYIGNIT